MLFFILLLLYIPVSFCRQCYADEYRAKPTKVLPAFSRKFDNNTRRLVDREVDFEPIRIYVYYGELNATLEVQNYIKNYVVDGAIKWFRKVLLINPIIGRLTFPGFLGKDCEDFKIPREHTTLGVNADVVIYFTAGNNNRELAGWAITCLAEKDTGYPLAGRLHLETAGLQNETFEDALSTVIHEMSHILAFSANLMDLWTKPDGSKYRNDEIILWGTERNTTVAKLKSPNVLARGKRFYNCSELDGIELEVSPTNGTLGSHWDKRVLNDDYMVSDFDIHDIVYSDISLAVFEDSGWYKVIYNYLSKPYWGASKGCRFLKEKCLKDEQPSFNEFCQNATYSQCDYRHLRKGRCNLKQYNKAIPSAFQYFLDPYLGGGDQYIDYCPVVKPEKKGNCRELDPYMKNENETYGEKMCENCRCLEGNYTTTATNKTIWHTMCHNVTCHLDAAIIHIKNVSVTCNFTGGIVKVPGFQGILQCPSSNILCRDMPCPDNCSGRGKCIQGVCYCDNGDRGGSCPGTRKPDAVYFNTTSLSIAPILNFLLFMLIL